MSKINLFLLAYVCIKQHIFMSKYVITTYTESKATPSCPYFRQISYIREIFTDFYPFFYPLNIQQKFARKQPLKIKI